MTHLDSTRYHPNSYIASRRSSLPRQGYGGVYERPSSNLWSPVSSDSRSPRGFPRQLSDYNFWATTAPVLRSSSTSADLHLRSDPGQRKSVLELARGDAMIDSLSAGPLTPEEAMPNAEVERESSPAPEPAVISIRRRTRAAEEHRLLEEAVRAKRARGEIASLPSVQLNRLAGDLLEMDGSEERIESSSLDACEPLSASAWSQLLSHLVSSKKRARSLLDKDYRESKRQVTQMRSIFEKRPAQILARFDRLVSDVTCFSQLACQLARQTARLGCAQPPLPSEALMDEKRAILKKQLAELPRLRQSLLARQGSLAALCPDEETRCAFSQRLGAFWTLAAQLSVLESELALDVELTKS